MRIDPIQEAWDKLNQSIKNTAEHYPEGRNILMVCLTRSAHRTSEEIIKWLKEHNINVKDLDGYIITDDND